jgi:hypothetical protein
MTTGPLVAFANREPKGPGLEVRINFGMLTGREATAAEIEELAQALVPAVGEVSIVAEERHEIDSHSEAAIHQVRIEIGADSLPEERRSREELAGRLIETAERWAHACIAERHIEVS